MSEFIDIVFKADGLGRTTRRQFMPNPLDELYRYLRFVALVWFIMGAAIGVGVALVVSWLILAH